MSSLENETVLISAVECELDLALWFRVQGERLWGALPFALSYCHPPHPKRRQNSESRPVAVVDFLLAASSGHNLCLIENDSAEQG